MLLRQCTNCAKQRFVLTGSMTSGRSHLEIVVASVTDFGNPWSWMEPPLHYYYRPVLRLLPKLPRIRGRHLVTGSSTWRCCADKIVTMLLLLLARPGTCRVCKVCGFGTIFSGSTIDSSGSCRSISSYAAFVSGQLHSFASFECT